MKQTLSREEQEWRYQPSVAAVILVVGVGAITAAANHLMHTAPVGQAILVLARTVVNVVPHYVWLGALVIVILWLALLNWAVTGPSAAGTATRKR